MIYYNLSLIHYRLATSSTYQYMNMCPPPPVIDLPPPLVECTQNITLGKIGNIVAKTLLPINVLLILGSIVAETKFASQNQKCFPTKSKIAVFHQSAHRPWSTTTVPLCRVLSCILKTRNIVFCASLNSFSEICFVYA